MQYAFLLLTSYSLIVSPVCISRFQVQLIHIQYSHEQNREHFHVGDYVPYLSGTINHSPVRRVRLFELKVHSLNVGSKLNSAFNLSFRHIIRINVLYHRFIIKILYTDFTRELYRSSIHVVSIDVLSNQIIQFWPHLVNVSSLQRRECHKRLREETASFSDTSTIWEKSLKVWCPRLGIMLLWAKKKKPKTFLIPPPSHAMKAY